MTSTLETVRSIIASTLKCDPAKVTPEACLFADLETDDLSRIEVMMAVEDHFDVELSDDEFSGSTTVASIVALIDGRSS